VQPGATCSLLQQGQEAARGVELSSTALPGMTAVTLEATVGRERDDRLRAHAGTRVRWCVCVYRRMDVSGDLKSGWLGR